MMFYKVYPAKERGVPFFVLFMLINLTLRIDAGEAHKYFHKISLIYQIAVNWYIKFKSIKCIAYFVAYNIIYCFLFHYFWRQFIFSDLCSCTIMKHYNFLYVEKISFPFEENVIWPQIFNNLFGGIHNSEKRSLSLDNLQNNVISRFIVALIIKENLFDFQRFWEPLLSMF